MLNYYVIYIYIIIYIYIYTCMYMYTTTINHYTVVGVNMVVYSLACYNYSAIIIMETMRDRKDQYSCIYIIIYIHDSGFHTGICSGGGETL